MKFSELNLEESVLQALDAMNFKECTPIQEHTIPVILEGKDLIGVAQTGTGKTAAYPRVGATDRPADGRFLLLHAHLKCGHLRRKRRSTI